MADAHARLDAVAAGPAPGLAVVETFELLDGEAEPRTDEGTIITRDDGIYAAGAICLVRGDGHGACITADLDARVDGVTVESGVKALEVGDGDAAALRETVAVGRGAAVDDVAVGARGEQNIVLDGTTDARKGSSVCRAEEGNGAEEEVGKKHGDGGAALGALVVWPVDANSFLFQRSDSREGG